TFVAQGDVKHVSDLARIHLLRLGPDGIHDPSKLIAPLVTIRSVEDQTRALQLAGKHEAVLVDASDWRVIPFENLIAAYRARGTRLIAMARDVADAKLLLETLESGVDVVLLPVEHAREAATKLASHKKQETLVEASVTHVRPVGLGDRACLDTASLLAENEGVLTGSSSHGLFLVASEARESGYVASRPFRVNAGAVHAYVLLPGGRTKYISELKAGDEVLASDPDGRTRAVVLGRIKLERRPFLLIEADANGKPVSILLQNAETIHLVTKQGTKSVVKLVPGDKVLVRLDEGGRHFGMSVDETIRER
ncbi:MAG: 3-dehydroquinate synthase II, partial [Candidatus Thermoplasmatota archaeon]